MKTKTKLRIISTLLLLTIWFLVMYSASSFLFANYEIKEVNCYDKYNSQIKNVMCETKIPIFKSKSQSIITMLFPVWIVMLFFGSMFAGIVWKKNEI